jgi:hypothetical protein
MNKAPPNGPDHRRTGTQEDGIAPDPQNRKVSGDLGQEGEQSTIKPNTTGGGQRQDRD